MSQPARTVSFFPGDSESLIRSFDSVAHQVTHCLEPTSEAAHDQTVAVRAVAQVEAALSLTDSAATSTLRFDTRTTASAYLFIRRTTRLRVAVLLLYVLMGLVETPWYCEGPVDSELCPGGHPTEDLSTWPAVTLPPRLALLVAFLLQGLLLADSAINLLVFPNRRARYFCLCLLAVSAAEVTLRLAIPSLPMQIRPYRTMRPLVLAAGSSRIRNGIERVALAAWCARWLYFTVAIFLFISTWMARVYFFDQGAPFDTYVGTLRAMFTCMTTANYPDVQTPITNQGGTSWLSFLFFASFLVIHIYVLLNIVFSDIYSKHGDIVKEAWCDTIALREEALERAFVLLASPQSSAVAASEKVMGREAWCDFYCCWHRWMPIVRERDPRTRAQAVFDFVQMHFVGGDPDPNDGGRPRLLSADGRSCGVPLPRRRAVIRPESLDVYSFQALVLTLGDSDVVRSLRHARKAASLKIAPGPGREAAAAFLARPGTNLALDVLLGTNLALLVMWPTQLQADGRLYDKYSPMHWLYTFWTVLWATEMGLRVWASGGLALFWLGIGGDTVLQRCEVILVFCATMGDLILMQPFVDIPMVFVKNLLVLRLLRALRIFGRRRRVQEFLRTVTWVVSAGFVVIWSYLVVLFTYAEVGLMLFGGVLRKSNSSLQGTLWFESAYWSNNFNSLASALMVMFEQAIVNNWFVVADAVRQAVGPWADLFFVSYHIVSVSVLTNVFVAFLVEAWQQQKQHLETADLAAATLAEDDTSSRALSPCLSPLKRSPVRQTSSGSAASTPSVLTRRLRSMTDVDESVLPSTSAIMNDMFASDVRDLFQESHALNVARFNPRNYIEEVPGLARLLRSDSLGEAVLPQAASSAPPLG